MASFAQHIHGQESSGYGVPHQSFAGALKVPSGALYQLWTDGKHRAVLAMRSYAGVTAELIRALTRVRTAPVHEKVVLDN